MREKQSQAVTRRIQQARFPVVKTLEGFDWSWSKTINQDQVRHLFSLSFLEERANVIFIDTVGLRRTHLATALGYHACAKGRKVRFVNTMEMLNQLDASSQRARLTTPP